MIVWDGILGRIIMRVGWRLVDGISSIFIKAQAVVYLLRKRLGFGRVCDEMAANKYMINVGNKFYRAHKTLSLDLLWFPAYGKQQTISECSLIWTGIDGSNIIIEDWK